MQNPSPRKTMVDPRFAASYEGRNKALDPLIPTSVQFALDVGCGRGGNAAYLAGRGVKVDGISWNQSELDIAKQFCRRVIRCNLNQGIAEIQSESYDLAVCSHLLEHIAYPENLLKDLYRSLKPNGYLLVAIPNLFFWEDRLKLLRGEFKYQESGTFDYTHVRWYSYKSMAQLLEKYGFVVDQFVADGWISIPGLRFLIGDKNRAKVNQAFCRWRPGLFGQQLIFRCIKPATK